MSTPSSTQIEWYDTLLAPSTLTLLITTSPTQLEWTEETIRHQDQWSRYKFGCPHPTHSRSGLHSRTSCIKILSRVIKLNLNNGYSNILGRRCAISSVKAGKMLNDLVRSGTPPPTVSELPSDLFQGIRTEEVPCGYLYMCMDVVSLESGYIDISGEYIRDDLDGSEKLFIDPGWTYRELDTAVESWRDRMPSLSMVRQADTTIPDYEVPTRPASTATRSLRDDVCFDVRAHARSSSASRISSRRGA